MEEWKIYWKNQLYEVSNMGNVRRVKDGKLLKAYPQRSGYIAYMLTDKNKHYGWCMGHRLVAETWLGEDGYIQGKYVDHINTNRADNRVENLRWATPLENANNVITKLNRKKRKNNYE